MRLPAVSGLIAVGAVGAVFAAPAATMAATAPAAMTATAVSKPVGSMFGVSCVSASNCVAVGEDWANSHPVVERWNGARWTATSLPLPSSTDTAVLGEVSCISANSCIAVGNYSANYLNAATYQMLAESWNGRSWTRLRLPDPSGGYGYDLGSPSCATAGRCVLTGVYILHSGRTAAFAEVLSGGTWKVYKLPGLADSAYNSVIEQVTCMSATNCLAVGSDGNSKTPLGAPANTAVAESWNGKKWSETKLATPAGSKGAWLYGLSCPRSKTCVAVGGRRLANGKITPLVETRAAATGRWQPAFPRAAGSDPDLQGVACASVGHCVAVGGGDEATAKTSPFSVFLNGKAWKYRVFPAPLGGGKEASDAYAVTCLSATECVAVGDTGTVPQYSPNPANYRAYGVSAFWNGKAWRLVPSA
jgi:hypothetical protein